MRARSTLSTVLAAASGVTIAASCAFPEFPFVDDAAVDAATLPDAGPPPDAPASDACARDCLGGACAAGACQPLVLYADPEAGPGGIYVTDLGTVFFTQYYGGRVVRELPDGGVSFVATGLANPVRVTGSTQGAFATAFAGGDASAAAEVVAVTGAGAPRRIITGPTVAGQPVAPWGIADTGKLLVWTNALAGGSVMTAAQDGRTASVLAVGGRPQEIAANAEFAWWIDADHSSLFRVALAGDAGAPVLATSDFVDYIAYAAGHLYTASMNTSSIGVLDDPAATGSVRELVSRYARLPVSGDPAVQSPHGVAVDDEYVYWVNLPGAGPIGSVVRARLDGTAPPELLAAGISQPDQIALTSTAIYWTTFGGTVYRLAKP